MRCVSCGIALESVKFSVRFPCPQCGEAIGRCGKCRSAGIRYTCKCGFGGP